MNAPRSTHACRDTCQYVCNASPWLYAQGRLHVYGGHVEFRSPVGSPHKLHIPYKVRGAGARIPTTLDHTRTH